MRVAFLVGSLEAGGLERFVTRVALEAQKCCAFEPVVICLNRRSGIFLRMLEANNIRVVGTRTNWHRSIVGIFSLKRTIESLGVDIVHSQVNYSILQQFVATKWAGKIFTITERSSYRRAGMSLFRRRLQYFFLKAAAVRYSANSRAVALHLAQMLKEPAERFSVIPNGVPLAFPSIDTEERRAALGFVPGDIVVGYVARMDPPKGHKLLIDVLDILIRERKVLVKCVLVGDGSLRKEIESAISERNLTSHIVLAGVVPDVENWMPLFDFVALLSSREGMPNAVIEAMAAGIPVIGTPVGNIPELLGSGAGIVVDERDINGIVDAFEHLSSNEGLRRSMGDYARELIRKKYSIDATLNLLVHYYRSILTPDK